MTDPGTSATAAPEAADRGFLLTPQQERQWRPGGVVSYDRCVLSLRGPLDEDALRRAVAAVAARHGALVTRLLGRPGLKFPLQSPQPPRAPVWRTASAESGGEIPSPADAPFVVTLERRGEDEHRLELRIAATGSDLRSLEVVACDLLSLYARQEPDDEEPVQFLEIAQWLRSLEDDEDAEVAASRWRERLTAAGPRRPLPFETPDFDPLAEVSIAAVPVTVDPAVVSALVEHARGADLAPTSLLAAAWRATLWWLSERSAVAVAEALDGRPFEELEASVGRFSLLVPVAVAPEGGESLLDLARRIEAARGEVAEEQDAYAALRRRWSDDEPRVGFDVGRFPETIVQGPIEARVQSVRVECEPVPLALVGTLIGDRLDLELRYDERFYDRGRAERLARLVADLLRSAAAEPEWPIDRWTRLPSDHALASLLRAEGAEEGRAPRSLPELVAEQAARVPDRPAVEAAGRVLTFAALRRETRRVAGLLREQGIGDGDVVGVCVLDPLRLVPALLGTLEVGASYLPIDPTHPEERIATTCRDAGARVMLTGGGDGAGRSLAEAVGVTPLALAPVAPSPVGDGEPEAPRPPHPESLAYVLYTSGSTGAPKGVMVSHAALANYLDWCGSRYGTDVGSGGVVHTPLGFDLTVTSLFGPLVSGRRVVFAPLERRVEGLAEVLRRERDLSLIKITPSQLRLLERFLPEDEAEGRVRIAVIGGESLLGEHLTYWRRHAPSMVAINEYGPTEAVVGCCVRAVTPGDGDSTQVPVGLPIAGTRIALVDRALDPVARGLAGEISIGGGGLARGYLGRPARTAESFVPDPFASEPGARLYRTGDLGVLGDDGALHFLGRNDRQVKLRGFRVELGEVEAVVARHPGVAEAVAVVHTNDRAESRLAVYYVPAPEGDAAVSDLMSWVRRFVPDYMVPSAFVRLDAVPLTHHGKVDVAALPEPEKGRPDLAVDFAPPENRLQRTIVEIWQEVLQMDEVGIHDNFFDLGGHSYLMFEVHRRLAESVGDRLSMVRLFQHPTVHALAQFLAGDGGESGTLEEHEKRGQGRRESMTQQRKSRRDRKLA